MTFSRPIIYIAAILVVAVLIIGFFIYPKSQELFLTKRNIAEKKLEIKYKEAYFAELTGIKAELGKYKKPLAKIDQALPEGVSLPSLFNFLQQTSSQSGMLLKTVSPVTSSPAKENPSVKENNFSISVMGSYSAFKNFLSNLEQSAKIIEIEEMSFSSPQEEISPFTFNMRLKTFSY